MVPGVETLNRGDPVGSEILVVKCEIARSLTAEAIFKVYRHEIDEFGKRLKLRVYVTGTII